MKHAANIPPVANAGLPQVITLPENSVTLSGSGTDDDGAIVYYKWSKISGPSRYSIRKVNSAVTSVTNLSEGIYIFQLAVTDNNGAVATSVVQITVNGAANIPPVANAGADQAITLPNNKVTLSGSGKDSDGTVVKYAWIQLSGPFDADILDSTSAITDITNLIQGVYQFELEITDDKGATGVATTQITVNAAANIPPIAVVDADQSITLPVNYTALSGQGKDSDGTIMSYLWRKISGPSVYTISDSTMPVTNLSGLIHGVYQFELKVTDNNGATGTAIVQITVNNPANILPVADAGEDKSITLPVDSLTLNGSGTDSDGSIVNYLWTKISGPNVYNIANETSAITNVTGLVTGVYQFKLQVTDDSGAVSNDTMQIIVNPSLNISPVADAGSDQTITLPVNSLILSGSGTDTDGTIVSYNWAKISGPSKFNITNVDSSVTTISGLQQGIYQFELQVTDNDGATAFDTVTISVNDAENLSPIADAGAEQIITLPKNSVSLTGSGSDPDGTIVSYLWTKISGPSNFTILDNTSAITNVSSLTEGIYQFQLQVTDDKGAQATDIVQVTVNAAANQLPVAIAGTAQTITLPKNSVSLSGSGTDSDGTIVNYFWTKISGPTSYNILNPSSANTDIINLEKGIYQFQLKVTDNNGATATDVIKITVNEAPNTPPVANAGANQTITLPVNIVSLAGSGSDADGTIAKYQWVKISGPSSYNIVNSRFSGN